jgi:hypothetical protein
VFLFRKKWFFMPTWPLISARRRLCGADFLCLMPMNLRGNLLVAIILAIAAIYEVIMAMK